MCILTITYNDGSEYKTGLNTTQALDISFNVNRSEISPGKYKDFFCVSLKSYKMVIAPMENLKKFEICFLGKEDRSNPFKDKEWRDYDK